ncbi:pilus assembly protein PilB [Variovorax ginsengisoli]|uniref:Pilus assembly protein PilB n=2 Tax=Variovorax guangxiensis TaxID=1775474 RepID=A0A502DVC3_9BURK|nr:pilus assembly protein PilB [Variovorax ginsengisoli]TPG29267.1 pilus assembly protein PilB [Variovorax guangxiensis]
MTTMKPLEWEAPAKTPSAEAADANEFVWPRPPGNAYPLQSVQTDPLACDIVGLNGQHAAGRMTLFMPEQSVALVQLPRARTTVPLRFEQFQSLTLTAPLAPLVPPVVDPQSGVPREPASSAVRIVMKSGIERQGRTVGHVESAFGLFLFPPAGEDGGVLRQFVPRAAFQRFEVDAPSDDGDPVQALAMPLLSRVVTTPDELVQALAHQTRMPMVRIGEALMSLGMVSADDLRKALSQQQRERGVPLGELLVRTGVVSRADLQVALTRKMGYPLVDLDVFPIEPEALRKISYAAAQRLQVMPLMMSEGRLVVAHDDPANSRTAVDEVEFIAQMKVAPVLAQCRDLERSLHAAYEKIGAASDSRFAQALRPIEFEPADTTALVETLEKEGDDRVDEDAPIEQSDNSLVRLINRMILEAHAGGVSDIHIESYPGREKIRIRFRKDGQLRTYLELPANYRNAMIARIKIMCDLDISERRKPQDGKINFAKFSPQHRIELRVATIPTNSGLEDVVMRILASAKPIALDRLGLSQTNLERLRHAVERPYGMVLCVGPTGSGKTTTLHSALSHINVPERKIWTAEDPIEITQPGLRQVQVNPRIDWTFAKALRAFLRADPDVIMVGEIRDEETAKMAVEASLTGHLVLSTLHTNSAPETVTRLLDMGMDPFNFADSLLAVLAQRLVRRLCTHCRTARPATQDEVEELLADYLRAYGEADLPESREDVLTRWATRHGEAGQLRMFSSPGCSFCDQTGFKGRAGLHELMVISRELRHLVQTGARAEALQATALREGMRTLRQDGIDKVLAGETTIDEVRATSNV